MSLLQAAQEQELAAVQQQAQQTAGAQQTASNAYGQAAAAPVQQPDPFVQTLVGNVASTLSGNQDFATRAQGNIRQRQLNELQQRQDNLTALRDRYLDASKASRDAGDLEAEIKNRQRYEKLATQVQLMDTRKASLSGDQTLTNMNEDAFKRLLDRKRLLAEAGAAGKASGKASTPAPEKPPKPPKKPTRPEEVAALIQAAKTVGELKRAQFYLEANRKWKKHPDVIQAIADTKARVARGLIK